MVPDDLDDISTLRQAILPMLRPGEAWNLDADPELSDRAIDLCGRDWFNERCDSAATLASSLALELTRYAAKHGLPFESVEAEAIRVVPRSLPDDTPTIGTGTQGIRELLDPWLRFWLRRGDERTVWMMIHPDGLAQTRDPLVFLQGRLTQLRPTGW